ncbi:MAG: hypothetical protein AAF744_06075 [Pseudomonadota bacterium]
MRFTTMGCRAMPRTELFEACALLQGSPAAAKEAHAQALMRCLTEALGAPARILAPGVTELTFDESWLLQLGRACARGDEASLTFLLNSRVEPAHRRLVRFLVHRISECFSLV